MPECVRAEMTDACCFACTIKFPPESSVGIWQPAMFQRASENPIAVRWELGGLLPHFQPFEKFRRDSKRLPRFIGFHIVYVLLNDATLYAKQPVKPIDIRPAQRQTLRDTKAEANAHQGHRSEWFSQVRDEQTELLNRQT